MRFDAVIYTICAVSYGVSAASCKVCAVETVGYRKMSISQEPPQNNRMRIVNFLISTLKGNEVDFN